jgi:hypothetical protein
VIGLPSSLAAQADSKTGSNIIAAILAERLKRTLPLPHAVLKPPGGRMEFATRFSNHFRSRKVERAPAHGH